MLEMTDALLADRIAANFDRLVDILEKMANRPPIVVAVPRGAQNKEITIDEKPKTVDSKHFRHRLVTGGWLIEYGSDEAVYLDYENERGERTRLVQEIPLT